MNKLLLAGVINATYQVFVEIGPPVPENKIFEGFLPYMGRGSHFGHVTSIMSINFHFLEPEKVHIKFGFDWPQWFLGKAGFKFHM